MHSLSLYHGYHIVCHVCSALHYTYVALRTRMPCMHPWWWQYMDFGFVARLWVDSLIHGVTNSISFQHLQACHFCWAPCHLPQVLCLFQVATVWSWHSHILGTPHFKPSFVLGWGPSPHVCSIGGGSETRGTRGALAPLDLKLEGLSPPSVSLFSLIRLH